MAIINRPDLVEKLRAAFGVLQGIVGSTISDELIGVVIVDDVSGPEVVSTQHPVTAIGGSNSAAAAGFLSKVGLQNPPGSGLDLFVEKLLVTERVDADLTVRIATSLPPNPNGGIKRFLDQRVPGSPVGVTFDENGSAAHGAEIVAIRLLALTSFYVDLGVTLPPGGVILLQEQIVNTQILSAEFYWTERIRRE